MSQGSSQQNIIGRGAEGRFNAPVHGINHVVHYGPFTKAGQDSDSTADDRSASSPGRSTNRSRKTTHEQLARATVRWDWDGKIPGRKTRGLAVNVGQKVDICDTLGGQSEWYKVHHQGACQYIPRAFLQVEGVYRKRHQQLFRTPTGRLPRIIDHTTPGEQPQHQQDQESFLRYLCLGPPKPRRPQVPAPPFDEEPDFGASNERSGQRAPDPNASQPLKKPLLRHIAKAISGFLPKSNKSTQKRGGK